MAKLFDLAPLLKDKDIDVILVQVDEAHSTAWPLSVDHLFNVDQVEPHKTFDDRIGRANHFVNKYQCPYKVFVDTWSNDFANIFRAWPDKYHCINDELTIVAKSEYHSTDMKEATVVEDCTLVLEKLLQLL